MEYNPLRTYTMIEFAELMHCHKDRVREWMDAGLVTPIKSGKSWVFSSQEIARFQGAVIGRNISNLPAINQKKGWSEE